MAAVTTRSVDTNGIRMAVTEAGEGPAVVLCHGFPELAYSWRHQLPALAAAGFHAIAPDMRGYGDTDHPAAVADYDIGHLTGDLAGLLDALGLERAVFVGHDWGGAVAWHMPLLHPERTAGVIGVNTPYIRRARMPPLRILRATLGESHYMVHFQREGQADRALARDVRRVFTQLVRAGIPLADAAAAWSHPGGRVRTLIEVIEGPEAPGRCLLSGEELAVYVRAFERTGFTGGINWYRNWETTPQLAGARIEVPALMICAELDFGLPPELAEPMRTLASDLELVTIPGCGHWTQQEKPAELNHLMIDWLTRAAPRLHL